MPGHGLSGEELQLVVVQTETVECDQTSKGLSVQIVQRVVTKTEPFDVLQALEGQDCFLFNRCSEKKKKQETFFACL